LISSEGSVDKIQKNNIADIFESVSSGNVKDDSKANNTLTEEENFMRTL
jgi:hypothetical protein